VKSTSTIRRSFPRIWSSKPHSFHHCRFPLFKRQSLRSPSIHMHQARWIHENSEHTSASHKENPVKRVLLVLKPFRSYWAWSCTTEAERKTLIWTMRIVLLYSIGEALGFVPLRRPRYGSLGWVLGFRDLSKLPKALLDLYF
jgi:hypothetical protein